MRIISNFTHPGTIRRRQRNGGIARHRERHGIVEIQPVDHAAQHVALREDADDLPVFHHQHGADLVLMRPLGERLALTLGAHRKPRLALAQFERARTLVAKDFIAREEFDRESSRKQTAEAALVQEQARKRAAEAVLADISTMLRLP